MSKTETTRDGDTGVAVLSTQQWNAEQGRHHLLVDQLVAGHERRRMAGIAHPVEDFLFTYYRLRPSRLRHWHPGLGIGLQDAPEHASMRFYRTDSDGITHVDAEAFAADRSATLVLLSRLLPATAAAPAQFGCFGLHEWAMVHHQTDADRRHSKWPLRLGPDGTDQVVQTHQLRCSHFDAFRFFTASAKPMNALQPTVWTRTELEQPGCLHANMDLYKWAYKLLPVVSSALLIDCFQLARDVRELDMRASPYDLTALGYSPIPIETPDGKAEYVAAQRQFAFRAAELRSRLIGSLPPVVELLTAGANP